MTTPPAGLLGRIRALWQEALVALRQWPWHDTLRTLGQRFGEDRLALTAGSLTFTTLIALVPLVTVMLAIFTAFPIFSSFQASLEKYFLQMLVPDTIARPVLEALTQFAAQANRAGSLGVLFLGATALALMLTIDRTLNAIWRVRQPRPIAQRVLVYWASLTLGPLVVGVSLSLTTYAVSESGGFVGVLPGGVSAALGVFEFALLAGAIAALFHYVPNTTVRWPHAWAGALFVASAFEVAKRGLGWYVDTVPVYSSIYGAFATLPILLLWVYLSWLIVLLGAVIAAYAPSLQMRVVRRGTSAGYRFELALVVLQRLDDARHAGRHGLSLPMLAETLRADPLELEPVLELLNAFDWVARLDEGGTPRHVLLCDPDSTPALPLLDALLVAPAPATAPFRQRTRLETLTLAELLR